jgi:hypothetical protein
MPPNGEIEMPLPEGYLPGEGDEVLIRVRAKRDSRPDKPEIECYFEIIGNEHQSFFMRAAEVHSLHRRNWNIGDTVTSDEFEGPGEVIAIDGSEVWIRDTQCLRWTVYANDLLPYVAPTVLASDSVSVDAPLDGAVDIPADTVMLMAPLTITPVSDGVLPAEPSRVPMPPVKPTRGARPVPETDAAYRHRIINAVDHTDEEIEVVNTASGAELDRLGAVNFVQRKGI